MELSGCHRARLSDSTPPGGCDTAQVNRRAAQAARQGGDFGQKPRRCPTSPENFAFFIKCGINKAFVVKCAGGERQGGARPHFCELAGSPPAGAGDPQVIPVPPSSASFHFPDVPGVNLRPSAAPVYIGFLPVRAWAQGFRTINMVTLPFSSTPNGAKDQ